jgi:hypothetical protein
MATPERLTAGQRVMLGQELSRHYIVDMPPFERCACGDPMLTCGNDIDSHHLEIAFELGVKFGRVPKPRRKIILASAVQAGHELMSARRRVLVTQVFARTYPDKTTVIEVAGTYKSRPSALHRVSTSFRLRPDHEVVVMNWVPPIS